MQTPAITLWYPAHRFKENFYLGFFFKEKRLASQVVFLVKSKHWVLAKNLIFCVFVFFSKIFCLRVPFFSESRLCTQPLFSHFVINLDRVFLQRTLKEKLPIFLINTLLLHIPLSALTDRQNDRQRDKLILVGLGNLRFLQVNSGWAG
jgi:hypothetical protein